MAGLSHMYPSGVLRLVLMRSLLCSVVIVLSACDFTANPSGTGGGNGSTGGGSAGGGLQLHYVSLTGSYGGTVTSHQSSTWIDRVQNRVDLSLVDTGPLDFDPVAFNDTFTGPGADLISNLIAGQRDVQANRPSEACAPLSAPIQGVPLWLKWVSTGDQVTISLKTFPARPFNCGYASWAVNPPEFPSATTTVTALRSGAPITLRFLGGSTYTQGANMENTEELTWDFTLVLQTGP